MDRFGVNTGESSNHEKWTKAIENRFCLLIHGKSTNSSYATTFENDCNLMEKSLKDNISNNGRKVPRNHHYVISTDEAESLFLGLVKLREEQIFVWTLKSLFKKFPHWKGMNEVDELVYDMYLRIRLMKAAVKVVDNWSEDISGLNASDQIQILDVVIERWKRADKESIVKRSEMLSRDRKLYNSCITRVSNILKGKNGKSSKDKTTVSVKDESHKEIENETDDQFYERYARELLKCDIIQKFKSNDKAHEILRFADDIFSSSLYSSGFPNNENVFNRVIQWRSFFRKPLHLIYSLESAQETKIKSDSTKHKDAFSTNERNATTSEDVWVKYLKKVLKYLTEGQNLVGVPDKWIWIYYSGDGSGVLQQDQAFKNMYSMIDLASELFTDVVVALDCCYPNVLKREQNERLRFLAPNNGRHPEHLVPNGYGAFTLILSYVLHGVNPEQCSDKWTDARRVSNCYKGGKATCVACQLYEKQLNENNMLCKYCEALMQECAKEKFIFPCHIYEHLKNHLCLNGKGAPHVTLPSCNISNRPLALAAPLVAGTAT